jgi:predicted nucleic acid-binding protein
MILVDTSVWIDHLHRTEPRLVAYLESGIVAHHSMVVGELALGSLRDRSRVLALLSALPPAPIASPEEVMHFVDGARLYGKGLSLVDAHLLTSLRLAPEMSLWSRDKRLQATAREIDVSVLDH